MFPELSIAIFSLIGDVDLEALPSFLLLTAATVLFSFSGYFISVVVDGTHQTNRLASNSTATSTSSGGHQQKSSQNSDPGEVFVGLLIALPFYFIPMFVTRLAFVLRYGLLPLALVAIVMHDSWVELGPLLERMLYSLVGRLDSILSSEAISSLIQYLRDAVWEVLDIVQNDET